MAVSDATFADTAAMLADALDGIDGLRVYAYVADTFRPPGVVVGLPSIDYLDPLAGFCGSTFEHALTLVVARANDRASQADLSGFVAAVAQALRDNVPDVELVDAIPGPINVNGTELPGYTMRVRVRA